jgi:hypothetical protein
MMTLCLVWVLRNLVMRRECWPIRVRFAVAHALDIIKTSGPLRVTIGKDTYTL